MGVAHALNNIAQPHDQTASLNNIALQTIAHRVGSYIKSHRRMARHCRANSNFMVPDP